MDLLSLVADMQARGDFQALGANPLAQFGPIARPYVGPSILPERLVAENAFREEAIRYRTFIANSGTRYSPAQKKASGELIGSFLVELGNQDVAREMTGRDYDALIALLNRNVSMEAAAVVAGWADTQLNRALIELTEKERWQAIVSASVTRVGDNGYEEAVAFPNPAGHRAAAGGDWSDDTYDPWDDIAGMADMLYDKGYTAGRIFTSRAVVAILSRNINIARRATGFRVATATDIVGRVNQSQVNAMLQADGLPTIETYDLNYRTQDGAVTRFLPADVMVIVADTGIDQTIDFGDTPRYLPGTLGYTAVGRAVGQAAPGRVIQVVPQTNKPPRLEGEAWSTSLPVITEPEAIAVITGIA